jgi:uncharacterized DUF497 family protein
MIQFEWDEAKAKANEKKHGVSFEDSIHIFEDPYVLSEQDRIEDGEQRWQSIGLVEGIVLLLVAHTVQSSEEEQVEVVRIISARRADRKERIRYDENRTKNSF